MLVGKPQTAHNTWPVIAEAIPKCRMDKDAAKQIRIRNTVKKRVNSRQPECRTGTENKNGGRDANVMHNIQSSHC
jgi:hypothetical protein